MDMYCQTKPKSVIVNDFSSMEDFLLVTIVMYRNCICCQTFKAAIAEVLFYFPCLEKWDVILLVHCRLIISVEQYLLCIRTYIPKWILFSCRLSQLLDGKFASIILRSINKSIKNANIYFIGIRALKTTRHESMELKRSGWACKRRELSNFAQKTHVSLHQWLFYLMTDTLIGSRPEQSLLVENRAFNK